jgi:hypothetical protein
MANDQTLVSLVGGLLSTVRDQQTRIERLEAALETLLDSPALGWKDTVSATLADLAEFDARSEISTEIALIDHAIQTSKGLK